MLARGGDGIERDLQVLEDCTASLITERRVSQPWGLAGGGPGAPGENWLLPGGDESRAERWSDKCTVELNAGDVVRMLTPGGGGWGAPPGGVLHAVAVEVREEAVALVPMADADVAAFVAHSKAAFVAELVASGVLREVAERRADEDIASSFPQGRPAPGHLLFSVVAGGSSLGYLWLGPEPDGADGAWWVWDVEVEEIHRGKGIGRRAMELAEDECRRRGARSLGLNVFAGSVAARRLYESLGYQTVNQRMRKAL